MTGRLIVASDGADHSYGALRVARAIAERDGAEVEVVAVAEGASFPASSVADGMAYWTPELVEAQREALGRAVHEQLAELGGTAAAWPVSVRVGSPAAEIVRFAVEHGGTLLLLGKGRHTRAGVWLTGTTAQRVVHLAHLPVLVLPPDASQPPRRAIVATDFGELSADAARTAATVVGTRGEVHLVHVIWEPLWGDPTDEQLEWERTYGAGAAARLKRLAERLHAASGVTARFHIQRGETHEEILALADVLDADLIAAGSHGSGFLERIVLGGLSTRLLRAGRHPILIAPPRALTAAPVAERTAAPPRTEEPGGGGGASAAWGEPPAI